jgi:hypothetical protein
MFGIGDLLVEVSGLGFGVWPASFRLHAPRPNFALDMTDAEREIMARHAAYSATADRFGGRV